jgi:hypothetical protein
MAIVVEVNGNQSGEGFLIAPSHDKTFAVPVGLMTDDGSSTRVKLRAEGVANIAVDQSDITVTPTEQFVNIHATSASSFRNDTVLKVLTGPTVDTVFGLTAITLPQIWFEGRFQARFATDEDFYNEKRGTPNGWNFTLEGEPDFVPDDSVATDINKPVGREVRFNNPVALRTHVPSIGVRVSSIKGKVGATTEEFYAGDPIIGQQVDLGPHTYLASNDPQNPADPPPAETTIAGLEAMAIFEFHIANVFSGKSRTSQDRPRADGFFFLTAQEQTEYGVVVDPGPIASLTFDNARRSALLMDYKALSPADKTGTAQGRNLSTRIAHLGGDVAEGISPLNGTLSAGWAGKEEYRGLINDSIDFQHFESSVLKYFKEFNIFNFFCRMFNYHSDEQCGQVHGSISTDVVPRADHGIRLARR